MDLSRLTKAVGMYQSRKLITANELAHHIIYVLAEQPGADNSVVQFIESLPDEARQRFFEILEHDHRNDFHRNFLFIGSGARDSTPEERANLRRVWELLKPEVS